MEKIDFQHQLSMSKIVQTFLNFFLNMNIRVGEQLLLKIFLNFRFWNTLFTKIDPKF